MHPDVDSILTAFDELKHELRIFMGGVLSYIGEHPALTQAENNVIHSYKSRIKDRDHLREKIIRKSLEGRTINTENFFTEITDLAGVRFLHLYRENFGEIDAVIRRKVESGDWHFGEQPKAYTWDPEVVEYLEALTWQFPKNHHLTQAFITS